MVHCIPCFYLGTISTNSKLTGPVATAADVKKYTLPYESMLRLLTFEHRHEYNSYLECLKDQHTKYASLLVHPITLSNV